MSNSIRNTLLFLSSRRNCIPGHALWPIGNSRSMRVEVRSVAPDANPYLVLYGIFKTGIEGDIAQIENLRNAPRSVAIPVKVTRLQLSFRV